LTETLQPDRQGLQIDDIDYYGASTIAGGSPTGRCMVASNG